MYKTGGWGKQAQLHQNTYRKRKALEYRQAIINKLGGCCKKCGFTDIRALQIDHINGGGCSDRKSSGNNVSFYKKVLSDIDNKYQLLCANCNWIKRYENKEFYKVIKGVK